MTPNTTIKRLSRRKPSNPNDPRIKRTIKLLGDTLIELIIEKGGYQNITIRDITDRAEVSRTTFYLHFQSIDELLLKRITSMYDDLMTEYPEVTLEGIGEAASRDVDFDHIKKYADFYNVMLGEQGSVKFVFYVMSYLAAVCIFATQQATPAGVQPRVPLEMLGHAISGAEIGVVYWWLRHNNMQMSPKEMGEMLYNIMTKGYWWAIGMDDPAAKS